MATVTELVDAICADTGIDATAASVDRLLALSRLNHAYKYLVGVYHEGYPQTDTIAVALNTLQLDMRTVALTYTFSGLRDLRTVDSTGVVSQPLDQISPERALVDQYNAVAGTPGSYAYRWPLLILPQPADGTFSFKYDYLALPPTLVESAPAAGQESTPTGVHVLWHEALLLKLAVVLVLEGMEGSEEQGQYHRKLFQGAMADYRDWLLKGGGGQYVQDLSSVSMFETPTQLTIRQQST